MKTLYIDTELGALTNQHHIEQTIHFLIDYYNLKCVNSINFKQHLLFTRSYFDIKFC